MVYVGDSYQNGIGMPTPNRSLVDPGAGRYAESREGPGEGAALAVHRADLGASSMIGDASTGNRPPSGLSDRLTVRYVRSDERIELGEGRGTESFNASTRPIATRRS